MQIIISETNGILIASVDGRLTVGSEDLFKTEMEKYMERPKIILDCAKMEYIDSTGLGVVVRFFKEFSSRGGKFALVALQPKPKLVFEITRAYKIFEIFDSVESALKSL